MPVAKMVTAGNRVHLDSKDPRIVRPKGDVTPSRKAGNVFVVDLWVRKDAKDRPVRSEGMARECKVVEFDFGGVEDAQE